MVNIKSLVLGAIIAFVFFFFCIYGTKLIYPNPEYNKFCNINFYEYSMPNKIAVTNCSYNAVLEKEKKDCSDSKGRPEAEYNNDGCEKAIKCNMCELDFQKADEKYSKNLFIIAVVFSLIVIAISAFFVAIESVSGGLMFGSLMFLIYGIGGYWRYMNDWLRFIILGIALIILIIISYKIANKKDKKGRK